ncbi:MAG: tyrosine-protein phosphatase [Gammaproteobacteria bacterium]
MERILKLPGAVNLRDFGGYAAADGRRVRRGRLFRSGTLAHLSGDAQEALLEMGIEVICDLRRQNELDHEPTPFPDHRPRRVHLPIEAGNSQALREQMHRVRTDPGQVVAFMTALNRELARDCAAQFGQMVQALLEAGDAAFLVHCSAGKDRTGFGAALILSLLGVPRETVVEDFLLSNTAIDFENRAWPQLAKIWPDLDKEVARGLSAVHRVYIDAALDEIDTRFGSFERYARLGLGLDEAAHARLRDRLLTG